MAKLKNLIFKTGVCRTCKATWDLDRTYTQADVEELTKLEAKCPECLSNQVAFPYAKGSTAPTKPVVRVAADGKANNIKLMESARKRNALTDAVKTEPGTSALPGSGPTPQDME